VASSRVRTVLRILGIHVGDAKCRRRKCTSIQSDTGFPDFGKIFQIEVVDRNDIHILCYVPNFSTSHFFSEK
jgi:hypothetical protein